MEKNRAVAIIPKSVPAKIVEQVEGSAPQVANLLPRDISLQQFQAGLWLQFTVTPKLAECTPVSLQRAVIKAAQKGLQPGRDCCILPFKNRKGNYTEATLVEEYQGVVRRLDRTGRVEWAKAEAVFQRDHFICDELAEVYEFRRHLGGDRGRLVCYFSAIKLRGSQKPVVRVCTIEEVDEVKRVMGRAEYEAWVKWPHEMGRKTAIKKQAKYMQLIDDMDDEADEEPGYVPDTKAKKNIIEIYGGDELGNDVIDATTGEVLQENLTQAHQDAPGDENGVTGVESDAETSSVDPGASNADFISPGYRNHCNERIGELCEKHSYPKPAIKRWGESEYKVTWNNLTQPQLQRIINLMEAGTEAFMSQILDLQAQIDEEKQEKLV